jgi:hypothetical protein
MFNDEMSSIRTITVPVPSGAAGYGGIPATYAALDHTSNWATASRGGGWTGWGGDWRLIRGDFIHSGV